MADEFKEGEFFTLTDEDGVESEYELIGTCELDGNEYYALVPVGEDEEYVILKVVTDEDGEQSLETIDDDDEFDKVADIFEDELFAEFDYDDERAEEGNE